MKNKNLIQPLIACLLLAFSTSAYAQKKVLGMPESYFAPIDCGSAACLPTSPKSKKEGWLVFSDRDNNPVYDKPNGNVVKTINFRDYFFVVDESNNGWIKIVEARVDELKIVKGTKRDVGWVPKEKMLLWNSGLVGVVTRIHKKVLLLNRADNLREVITKQDKKVINIYRGPATPDKEPDKHIFEYYFILKMESQRYLLSEEAIVNPATAEDKIIGWVRSTDCDIWDTRVCLEPNFDENAFLERKLNPELRIRAYTDSQGAIAGAQGNGLREKIFWENDPVIIENKEAMAASNPRRFNGTVVRFPMVGLYQNGNVEYFKSGLIGSINIKEESGNIYTIPEHKYAQLKEKENKLANKASKVNVFFVVEGTDNTYPFKQQIIQGIREINSELLERKVPEVKFGALVYRDIPEESVTINGKVENRLIEYQSLTSDMDKVVEFLQNSEFKNYVDRDEYTAMYYGLHQALSKAGFRQDELNIIVLMGGYGDFRADGVRKNAAKGHPAFFDSEGVNQIIANLSHIGAHLYAIQLRNDGYRASRGFTRAAQNLILENAKFDYIKFFGNQNNALSGELIKRFNLKGVSMELTEAETIPLNGAFVPGSLVKPASGGYLGPNQLASTLRDEAKGSMDFIHDLKARVTEAITEGNAVPSAESFDHSAGSFTDASFARILLEISQNNDFSLSDVVSDKYKLFTEVYFPQKYQSATYPLVSYVLFMPERDLAEYFRTLERCLIAEGTTSYDKKRELLFEVYKSLVEQFTGENLNKKIEEVTRAELKGLMQGVYQMGLRLDDPLDHKLGDVLNEKKISNLEIDELLRRFREVSERLSNILRDGERYDFCYKTDEYNRYYWIALQDAF